MSSWSKLTRGDTYKSPAFIALVTALCVAMVVLLHHCVVVACCHGGDRDRRRRRQHHHRHVVGVVTTTTTTSSSTDARRQHGQEEGSEEEDGSVSVEVSTTSRTHLVAAAVVCRYRKEEAWNESTCPVCLADFADGEPVRVLPECMHYFHAECIDTWLRGGSTSCPMCRAETTPTPSHTHTHTHSPAASVRHHLELSVSLEEILVRT